jgi:hypothetical protein
MDAEYIAGAEAAKEAVWIRNFINDPQIPGIHVDTVPLYIDNNSALKLTRNPEFHSRSKHINIKHHFIREKVEENAINTQRIGTVDNLADVFTKALPKPTHENLTSLPSIYLVRGRYCWGAVNKVIWIHLVVPRSFEPRHRGELDSRSRDMSIKQW